MTVAELMHGRGTPTPLHEVAVDWPQFWAYQRRVADRQKQEAENQAQGTLG